MNIEKYIELKGHLFIDPLTHSEHLMRISAVLQDAADLASETTIEERAAKHALDVVMSEVAIEMRSETVKISEATISANLSADLRVQDARSHYDEARGENDKCKALFENLKETSHNLRKIAEMMLAGFITPNTAYASARTAIAAERNKRAE